MPVGRPLTLDPADPRVIAAALAEARLYADFGLSPQHIHVPLGATGLKIRVTVLGSGRPILIVPGNTGDVFPLVPLMAKMPGRQLIAVNRPGGGLSDGMDHRSVDIRRFAVETLETVLAAFDLRDADVMAHSIGAHWCFWLAMDRPHLVRRLVTLGNPGNVMLGRAPWPLRLIGKPPFSWFAGFLLGRMLSLKKPKDSLRLLHMMGHDASVLDALPLSYGECYARFRQLPHFKLSLLSLLANAAPAIMAADLAGVKQPVSLLWGTKDTFAGVDVGQAIANALPQGVLHEIPGAGHLPWLEQSELCAQLALHFLEAEEVRIL